MDHGLRKSCNERVHPSSDDDEEKEVADNVDPLTGGRESLRGHIPLRRNSIYYRSMRQWSEKRGKNRPENGSGQAPGLLQTRRSLKQPQSSDVPGIPAGIASAEHEKKSESPSTPGTVATPEEYPALAADSPTTLTEALKMIHPIPADSWKIFIEQIGSGEASSLGIRCWAGIWGAGRGWENWRMWGTPAWPGAGQVPILALLSPCCLASVRQRSMEKGLLECMVTLVLKGLQEVGDEGSDLPSLEVSHHGCNGHLPRMAEWESLAS
ncbi:uncharacterized protein LOC141490202 [Macrotis lagotis]|uniref:uncharacterized protein LOC141490202 n=1 Tax=Macrotis lagotis TaxID=92651 RepID=UPI003D698E48